jgi:hypothetical protein
MLAGSITNLLHDVPQLCVSIALLNTNAPTHLHRSAVHLAQSNHPLCLSLSLYNVSHIPHYLQTRIHM